MCRPPRGSEVGFGLEGAGKARSKQQAAAHSPISASMTPPTRQSGFARRGQPAEARRWSRELESEFRGMGAGERASEGIPWLGKRAALVALPCAVWVQMDGEGQYEESLNSSNTAFRRTGSMSEWPEYNETKRPAASSTRQTCPICTRGGAETAPYLPGILGSWAISDRLS
jgi:hypothetical protein